MAMRQFRLGVGTIVVVLILGAVASFAGWQEAVRGAAPSAPAIEEVRRAYAQCREIQKQAAAIELYQGRTGKPPVRRWQREQPPEAEQTGRTMKLFTADSTVRMAIEGVDALSRDWGQRTEHCFRSDGSVAFVLAVLWTFHGNVQVEDRMYFNPRRENIRKLRRVFDLKTNKPIKPEGASFMEQKLQLFRSADELLRAIGPEIVFPSSASK